MGQKVLPKTLFAAPFRKEAPHPWAYAQPGFIPSVIVVFLSAEPSDTDRILFFHPRLSFAHAYHAPLSFKSILRGFEKEKEQALSLSLSELLGNLSEEVVGVDGVVDERLPALVMDASAQGRPLPKTLFHGHAEPRLVYLPHRYPVVPRSFDELAYYLGGFRDAHLLGYLRLCFADHSLQPPDIGQLPFRCRFCFHSYHAPCFLRNTRSEYHFGVATGCFKSSRGDQRLCRKEGAASLNNPSGARCIGAASSPSGERRFGCEELTASQPKRIQRSDANRRASEMPAEPLQKRSNDPHTSRSELRKTKTEHSKLDFTYTLSYPPAVWLRWRCPATGSCGSDWPGRCSRAACR